MVGTPTQEQLDGIRSDSTQWDAKAKRVYEVGESGESASEAEGTTSQKYVTDKNVQELLVELIEQLKITNMHLQSITDEEISTEDIDMTEEI